MKNYLFSLDNRSSDLLDQISEELCCSRSAALRIAIRFYCVSNQVKVKSSIDFKNLPDLPFLEVVSDD